MARRRGAELKVGTTAAVETDLFDKTAKIGALSRRPDAPAVDSMAR
jgi:hypothetical protein